MKKSSGNYAVVVFSAGSFGECGINTEIIYAIVNNFYGINRSNPENRGGEKQCESPSCV